MSSSATPPQAAGAQVLQPDNSPEAQSRAAAVAAFLRKSKVVQSKQGIFNGKRCEYFRVKRAIRALMSDEYQGVASKAGMPRVETRQHAVLALALLTMTSNIIRVDKQPPKKGDKKDKPVTLQLNTHQDYQDDMHYVWLREPASPYLVLAAVGVVLAVLALVMFPLWPPIMRRGAWYLSMAALGVVGLFIALAIFRLVFFVASIVVIPPGIWIYPNLFADCGVIESFQPAWAWRKTKSPAKAKTKGKSSAKAKQPRRHSAHKQAAESTSVDS